MKLLELKNETSLTTSTNFEFQRNITIAGIVLFLLKLLAWHLTDSNAVYSDAMESIVNIIAGFMGLYSLYVAAKPKDSDHPYGHGKVEFITSGIEGALIIFAGILIIIEAVNSLIHGNILQKLDYGILIIAATAALNYLLGYLSIKKGKKVNSAVLISSGKHLQSDTLTTGGVVLSLLLVYFTGIDWIDTAVALLFAVYIMFVGYKIIRKSLRGIMDEADPKKLRKLAKLLDENRKPEWIDVHNTRIQQHGSKLHIDSHITLPYYFELRTAHGQMEEIIQLILKNTDRNVEFNFHMDDCKPISCQICDLFSCPVREREFVGKPEWNAENIAQVNKHSVENL